MLFLAMTVAHSREALDGGGGKSVDPSPPGPLAIVCNENLPTGQSGAMNATRTFQFSPGCPSVSQGSPVC